MSQKVSIFLVKTGSGKREINGREISLLQQSGVKIKILKKLKNRQVE
jgi:hypothetical protein